MYQDPSQIRDHVVAIRLSEEELKIVQAAADKAGMQLATFCREAAMKALSLVLSDDPKKE